MSINIFKIRKWIKMINGDSIYHVNQNEGSCYSKDSIKGYYNDLREKVLKSGLDYNELPTTIVDSGDTVYFSIAIFQYGLGAYDLYLTTGDDRMLSLSTLCAEWALTNQKEDGSWITFEFDNPMHPYSSMAQGEGISLLVRMYKETDDKKYIEAAKSATDFMLKPLEEGGTTRYDGEKVYFYERTGDPVVLNGWIFSYWGLLDYWMVSHDNSVRELLNMTIQTMINELSGFDTGYWSKYDMGKMIASPFYHRLHIAQLNVMYDLTNEKAFKQYSLRWQGYQRKKKNRIKAFVVKAWQKIKESD